MKTKILEIEMGINSLQKKLNKLSSDERRRERLEEVARGLGVGRKVTDFRFDQVYSPIVRKLSKIHWTPVEVAVRASELLVANKDTRILDVGSGSGKFCIVGSLSSPGRFFGIEQRPHFVEVARKAAQDLGADRASFLFGNMVDLDWSLFDGFYLFNPFYENILKPIRIDASISHNREKFNRYIEIVRKNLRLARPGTKVATYHGFGGDMPVGYCRVQKEPIGTSYLELWIKTKVPLCEP